MNVIDGTSDKNIKLLAKQLEIDVNVNKDELEKLLDVINNIVCKKEEKYIHVVMPCDYLFDTGCFMYDNLNQMSFHVNHYDYIINLMTNPVIYKQNAVKDYRYGCVILSMFYKMLFSYNHDNGYNINNIYIEFRIIHGC